jgi:hypothetical protein
MEIEIDLSVFKRLFKGFLIVLSIALIAGLTAWGSQNYAQIKAKLPAAPRFSAPVVSLPSISLPAIPTSSPAPTTTPVPSATPTASEAQNAVVTGIKALLPG